MDPSFFAQIGPAALPEVIAPFLGGFVDDPAVAARATAAVRDCTSRWEDGAAAAVIAHLSSLGDEHRVYPAEPRCRDIAHAWCAVVLPDPELVGVEHLAAALSAGPTVVLANHLSYLDTLTTDWALFAHGHGDLADRLVTVAGPKVYDEIFRRMAAASLHTLPAPQSTSFGHTAHLPPRELARRALESVQAAQRVLAEGFALQVYPEGSRSRSGRLGPFLRGVRRYLAVDGLLVVPSALSGTSERFPVDATRVTPGPTRVAFGEPYRVSDTGGPGPALVAAFHAVAGLLPAGLQPEPGTPPIR